MAPLYLPLNAPLCQRALPHEDFKCGAVIPSGYEIRGCAKIMKRTNVTYKIKNCSGGEAGAALIEPSTV